MRLLPFILASRRQERFAARSKEWRDTAVFAGKKIAKRNWKKNCNLNKAAKLLLRIIQRDAISDTSYIATSLNHFSGINHDETFAKINQCGFKTHRMNPTRFDPSFTRLGETAVFPYTNATRNNAKIENKNLVSKSAFQIRTESKNTFHIIVLHDAMIPPAALLYHVPYKPCTTNNLLICFNLYKLVNWLLNSVCYRNSAKRKTKKNVCLN